MLVLVWEVYCVIGELRNDYAWISMCVVTCAVRERFRCTLLLGRYGFSLVCAWR